MDGYYVASAKVHEEAKPKIAPEPHFSEIQLEREGKE
jgi:hypothetical protein